MGKSLKNIVTPDYMYENYGADTFRLYEMSMGPLDESRPWNTRNVVGGMRFLQRLWRNVVDETTGEVHVTEDTPDDEDPEAAQQHDRRSDRRRWRACVRTPPSPSSSCSTTT
jgi:leucyl-tRNA synthetase